MRYCSTRDTALSTGFSEAVLQGLAPDGGLYVPGTVPIVSRSIMKSKSALSDIGYDFIQPFVNGEIANDTLKSILDEVFNFPIPLIEVEDNIYALELFHGPTLAFKDVGARFMGRVLPLFNHGNEELDVLVATSGDTGVQSPMDYSMFRASELLSYTLRGRCRHCRKNNLLLLEEMFKRWRWMAFLTIVSDWSKQLLMTRT